MYKFVDKKQKRNQAKIKRNIGIFLVIILLVVVGLFSFLNKSVHTVGVPLWRGENIFIRGFKNVGYYFANKKYLSVQNQKLTNEVQDLKLAMDDYNILKNENTKLKEDFGRIASEDKFTLATVLMRPSLSPYDTIVVDAGHNLNIKEGSKVYADAKHPIGVVSKVHDSTSEIVLYSNPNYQTEVMIDGLDTTITLSGRGGGNFEMNTPHDFDVPSNAVVFLPSLNSEIVATVAGLLSKPTDLNKKYLLRSIVNIQNIKFVQIKKN